MVFDRLIPAFGVFARVIAGEIIDHGITPRACGKNRQPDKPVIARADLAHVFSFYIADVFFEQIYRKITIMVELGRASRKLQSSNAAASRATCERRRCPSRYFCRFPLESL